MKRYEVQVRMTSGWMRAGNVPSRTLHEGMQSLDECATFINGGATRAYRLVRLQPVVIASRKATLRWDERRQKYVPLKHASSSAKATNTEKRKS